MLIQVWHHTQYLYSSPVVLGIHKLYLHPQHRPYFRIEHQKFEILPIPSGQNFRQDLAGNWYSQSWFTGETEQLEISTEWIFKLREFNPFAFILDKSFEDKGWNDPFFQFSYEENTAFLIPFLQDKEENQFTDFLMEIKKLSTGLVDFLVNLTQAVYQGWEHQIRAEENIWEPGYTFENKTGSCRDLALMEIQMLRELGLASRFVSGYAFNPELEEGHELHGWVEVFLPGAGWIGLDPSLGLLTDHHHIPLASHPNPFRTLPVQGTFAGKADSELTTRVDIKLLHKTR
ncbi:transglutaminase-like putative cysteine protease [Algoriphagus boseongensis]|uniref:Transglutaminase-like putative cysteine protease n=1 Tax=Algoriphagus boseongensis TaxID=1442587 RepID=A0A4R6T6N3_9BACT|nr:transglutaminase family protein [Algoriphagus boseongensis]TDQ18261.1 transglutaminase-like putative cysteine protease [Algoriphagus boseongensis]